MLSEAARCLRRGGRLVYATCSVEWEENEAVVAAFLHSHTDFKQIQAAPAPTELLLHDGAARTWPQRDDVDGFYVAAIVRQ
jgi:16S rRNA (cytosine967-C5)-methyltransferase